MRVSDAERQRAVEELRRHCASGRLDIDEYATRVEAALAATTLAELDRVLGDLPMLRVPEPAETVRRGLGRLGVELPAGRQSRLGPRLVVLLTVLVVVVVVVLAAAASWVWAALLLVGWSIGVLQGRFGGRRW